MARIYTKLLVISAFCAYLCVSVTTTTKHDESDDTAPHRPLSDASVHWKLPTVLIVTLFRNKAHVMPYYFSFLERLDYPKERMSLW